MDFHTLLEAMVLLFTWVVLLLYLREPTGRLQFVALHAPQVVTTLLFLKRLGWLEAGANFGAWVLKFMTESPLSFEVRPTLEAATSADSLRRTA